MPFTRPPPTPGNANPGDLYVDLATRSLWLGVNASVDPSLYVLISDILQTEIELTQVLTDANAYANSLSINYAPAVHTHVAADITDFTAAVNAVIAGGPAGGFVTGMIVMWSGSLASIGVGLLADWALCDGTNGTPDLRDKFILGAGNLPVGAVNSQTVLTAPDAGGHTHTINGTAITAAQMPQHRHYASVSGSGSGGTDAQGVHVHGIGTNNNTNAGRSGVRAGDTGPMSVSQNTEAAGNHAHNVSVNVSAAGYTDYQGSSQSHTHTETTAGSHTHAIPQLNLRETIPYYALAYIMKL